MLYERGPASVGKKKIEIEIRPLTMTFSTFQGGETHSEQAVLAEFLPTKRDHVDLERYARNAHARFVAVAAAVVVVQELRKRR